jgi:putative transposase
VLKEVEAGKKVADLCRQHGSSEATYHNWKAKFGDMSVSDAQRLKALEAENGQLKRLLTDSMLYNAALKDIVNQKW